ncbi:nucleoside triphosphate pyrophosphohydrolase [Bacillus sp. 31A1R]|uniref:Nucleoside triphosphate pyrophosphohydrolase n=1 Tax=Robertmurraya mangrovi TaxID=3098077 RepID=A0ABU5IW74_9BACI|nr:nucleoside triphosphate pyrophosphohydrolase [Bacillus sp. 31A1R]MDZ5471407.1 nucleoside triphosphate pyrophosphohydrolase [Bacillus sp. 31A1R]
MPVYNKLVRDRIPEIIEKSGKRFTTSILNESEFLYELRKKSQEELEEYLNATTGEEALGELADLLEILHALAESHGSSIDEVDEFRKKKAEKRGGFKDRIYLLEVED